MTELAELSARWETLGRGEPLDVVPPVVVQEPLRYYRPLAAAADQYIRWAQSPHERVYTGINALDDEMRGIAPGEMAMIVGFSHSGKTLTLLEILKHNRHNHVAYFVPDEPRTLTLIKLACVVHGVDALALERRVSADEPEALDLLRETAEVQFPHLAVFDESVTISDMERATGEVSDLWGQKPDLVVFDYLELLTGGGDDVPSKANAIKAWGRRHDVPFLMLHQTSRTAGADGKRMTMSSGAYGGEQQSTHVIGVRRKLFEIKAQIYDLEERLNGDPKNAERLVDRLAMLRRDELVHKHTLTLNLVKNKRPGGKLVDDVDFEIDHGTGRLTPLYGGDLPNQFHLSQQRSFDEPF